MEVNATPAAGAATTGTGAGTGTGTGTGTAITCPANTTGTYPNCAALACPSGTATFPNCVSHSTGTATDTGTHTGTYTNNGNGTITANATGLMWQQQDDSAGRDWATAGTYCAGLALGGYSNWRLPTKDELFGIVDTSYNPTINPIFTNTQQMSYWSSTTYAGDMTVAWVVLFYDGNIGGNGKAYGSYVRCLRLETGTGTGITALNAPTGVTAIAGNGRVTIS